MSHASSLKFGYRDTDFITWKVNALVCWQEQGVNLEVPPNINEDKNAPWIGEIQDSLEFRMLVGRAFTKHDVERAAEECAAFLSPLRDKACYHLRTEIEIKPVEEPYDIVALTLDNSFGRFIAVTPVEFQELQEWNALPTAEDVVTQLSAQMNAGKYDAESAEELLNAANEKIQRVEPLYERLYHFRRNQTGFSKDNYATKIPCTCHRNGYCENHQVEITHHEERDDDK